MTRRRISAGASITAVVVLAALASGCAPSAPPAPQPSATPVATPTPGPEEAAAAAVLAAFDTLRARDDLTYHLSQTTTTRVSGRRAARAAGELDVDGPAFAATLTAGDTRARVVRVDGVTWTKAGKRAWKNGASAAAEAATEALGTWRDLGPLDGLVYAGRNHVDSSRLDFTLSRPAAYQTAAMREQGMQGTIDELTLTLASDGTPIRLRFHATATFTSGALADRKVSIDSVIDVTRFGEAITIKPPK